MIKMRVDHLYLPASTIESVVRVPVLGHFEEIFLVRHTIRSHVLVFTK